MSEFKKHIKVFEEQYESYKSQLTIAKHLQNEKVYDNDDKVTRLENIIFAYEYFFPFF